MDGLYLRWSLSHCIACEWMYVGSKGDVEVGVRGRKEGWKGGRKRERNEHGKTVDISLDGGNDCHAHTNPITQFKSAKSLTPKKQDGQGIVGRLSLGGGGGRVQEGREQRHRGTEAHLTKLGGR